MFASGLSLIGFYRNSYCISFRLCWYAHFLNQTLQIRSLSQFRPATLITAPCFWLGREHTRISPGPSQGKGICSFVMGELAVRIVFFNRDAEIDVRACRGITKDEKGVPINFDKGIETMSVTGDLENDLSERRRRKFDELSDWTYFRIEEIVVEHPFVENDCFPDHRPHNEVLQIGKSLRG